MARFPLSDEQIFEDAFEYSLKDELSADNYLSDCSVKSNNIDTLIKKDEKDSSATNGSSIAFIIEYKSCKLLFLGDAHEDIIYEQLLLLKNKNYEMNFNLVKISHHGSNKNISLRLLNMISSDKFMISTDGSSHEHPDIETVAKIISSNRTTHRELIFNYRIDSIFDKFESLQKSYNFSLIVKEEIVI